MSPIGGLSPSVESLIARIQDAVNLTETSSICHRVKDLLAEELGQRPEDKLDLNRLPKASIASSSPRPLRWLLEQRPAHDSNSVESPAG